MTLLNIEKRKQEQHFYLLDISLAELKKEYTRQDDILQDLKSYVLMHIINNQATVSEIKSVLKSNKNQDKKLLGQVCKEIINKNVVLDFEISMIFGTLLKDIKDIELYQALSHYLSI